MRCGSPDVTTAAPPTPTWYGSRGGPGLLDDQRGDRQQGGEQQRRFQAMLQCKGSRVHGTVFDDLVVATSVILQRHRRRVRGRALVARGLEAGMNVIALLLAKPSAALAARRCP